MKKRQTKDKNEPECDVIQISLRRDEPDEMRILAWFDAQVDKRSGRKRNRASFGRDLLWDIMQQQEKEGK